MLNLQVETSLPKEFTNGIRFSVRTVPDRWLPISDNHVPLGNCVDNVCTANKTH
jgi:hypothetical protein